MTYSNDVIAIARVLSEKMEELMCYEGIYSEDYVISMQAHAKYTSWSQQAKALLGPEAECSDVDPDLWQHYSDCFKSEEGIRPSWSHTVEDVESWFTRAEREAEEAKLEEAARLEAARAVTRNFNKASNIMAQALMGAAS